MAESSSLYFIGTYRGYTWDVTCYLRDYANDGMFVALVVRIDATWTMGMLAQTLQDHCDHYAWTMGMLPERFVLCEHLDGPIVADSTGTISIDDSRLEFAQGTSQDPRWYGERVLTRMLCYSAYIVFV